MKSIVIIFSCFLLLSCAGMGSKREVTPNNSFLSIMPNLSVDIDESLKYRGTFKLKSLPSSDKFTSPFSNNEYHVWSDSYNQTAVVIIFKKLVENAYKWNEPNIIKDGKTVFNVSRQGNWVTRTGLAAPNNKENLKCIELGVYLRNLRMTKMWIKNSTYSYQLIVLYAEKFNGCDTEALNNFEDKANSNIHILN